MPIPKIIHQTYKIAELPPLFQQCQTQIQRLHPHCEYRFHTDADIDAFIKTQFPTYYDAFMRLPRKIMQIDMVRYFWMYEYGGIYADLDYYIIRPFDLWDKTIVLPANRETIDGPTCLGNCIFASEPRHPFWKTLMDTLFTIDRSKEIDPSIDSHIDGHSKGTGPAFVYTMWRQWQGEPLYIPPRMHFHPPTHEVMTALTAFMKKGESYGFHRCSGVWRSMNPSKTIAK
jgi:mannosyltransferase OCH1-like enzyme